MKRINKNIIMSVRKGWKWGGKIRSLCVGV